MSINELILLCLKNDERAKRELVHLYAPKIASVCRRYLKHKADIEDVVQEALIKVFRYLPKYDQTKGEFHSWVYKIGLNEVYKALQTKLHNQIDFTEEYTQKQEPFVEAQELAALEMQDLMAMIDILPLARRTVFNMYYVEGYKHQEIAQILQISEGTSKAHLNQARIQLKEIINQQHIER